MCKMEKCLRVMPRVARNVQREALRVSVISCSEFGCDDSSTQSSYFRAKPVIQASKAAKTWPTVSDEIVIAATPLVGLMLAILSVFVTIKICLT